MRWVDSDGGIHELPPCTRQLAKRVSRAQAERDDDARWKAQLAVVTECLGDGAEAVLGGTTIDTVDVARLEAAFVGIAAAYEAPKRQAEMERIDASLASFDVERLQAIVELMGSLGDSRQGFSNVR